MLMHRLLISAAIVAAPVAVAAEQRAHLHGHAALNVAVEGDRLLIEFISPGADIVGFEHAAESEADKAKIAEGVETLGRPLRLFALPEGAACEVAAVAVEIEGLEDDHDKHDHDKHDHDKHDHDKHAEDEAHNEFHAQYAFTCSAMDRLSRIDVRLFEVFPTLSEIEAAILTAKGSGAAELTKDEHVIDLRGKI